MELSQFFEWIQSLDTGLIYLVIFLSGFLENCIPPIPGDMVTVLAASMVGVGRLSYLPTFLTATAGNLIGFMTMYQIGRFFGKDFFLSRNFKYFPATAFEKAEAWFTRHGYRVILFNRFLSGLRSVISLFAGMTHLQKRKIIPLAFLSACMWDGVLIYAGYVLGDNWKAFENLMAQYNRVVFSILGLIALILLIRWFIKRNSDHDR
ncbi:DedA family protein [bacterium]|nr:DedA family protein [bacterium]NUN46524.1 DedA family protein [bacterium]